ncbi:MAG TPA: glycosyltransferase family 4 protein [Candidatus Thermoplasmatota archaeon]|nr:glycosyltransferase family 4 protein [Candidatus Thermoplasmatota archaeon]
MHVVFSAPYFVEGKFGGGELWCREVARGLAARGHTVEMVTTNLTRHGSAFEPKAPRRGTTFGIPTRRHRVSLLLGLAAKPFGFFPIAPTLPFDPAFRRADVVLVSGIEDPTSALAILGARLAKKPVLVMAHTHMDLVRTMGPDRRLLLAPLEGSHAAYVQINTEAERAFWNARIEARRVLDPAGCGSNPVPREWVEGKEEARRALGIPADEKVVLFLARINWGKGVARGLEATRGIAKRGGKLSLVGFLENSRAKFRGEKVSLLDFLDRRYDKADHRIVGDVDERTKHRWLAACDVLVLPSHNESFGIVILEAWQHGKPVVVWNQGGMPAVVEDGADGFVVDTIDDFRDRVETLLAKPELAARMGAAGREKQAKRYTWEAVVERVERNVRRVLEVLEPERERNADTTAELRGLPP